MTNLKGRYGLNALVELLDTYLLKNTGIRKTFHHPAISRYYQKALRYINGHESILLDENGTILNWNNTYEKMQGYSCNEIIGQNIALFYMPGDRQRHIHDTLLKTAGATGRSVYKGKMVKKDGTTFFGQMVLKSIKGTKNEVVGFIEMLHELREAESD